MHVDLCADINNSFSTCATRNGVSKTLGFLGWYVYSIVHTSFDGVFHEPHAGNTHAVVHFETDDSTCVVPIKKIVNNHGKELRPQEPCHVKWTDNVTYSATVLALGGYTTYSLCEKEI